MQAVDRGSELELAALIIETVNLEDVHPEGIDPDGPLFDEGLGLDSIDALEIALAVTSRYGFALRADDPENQRIFASLRALAQHIVHHRTR